MYKKLSEWQQQRRDQSQRPDPRNTHGIDPKVWATSPEPDVVALGSTHELPTVELGRLRLSLADINAKIRASQDRYNGRLAGKPLAFDEFQNLTRRKERITRRVLELELLCSVEKGQKKAQAVAQDVLEARAARSTLATVFMAMAKEMLADEVYQRIFIAAVHRHEDR